MREAIASPCGRLYRGASFESERETGSGASLEVSAKS